MVDGRSKVFLLYSFATDITGKNLANEMGIQSGKVIPDDSRIKYIINWGRMAKPEDLRRYNNYTFINHPTKVLDSSDKFKTLVTLRRAGLGVPYCCSAMKVWDRMEEGHIRFPIVGRKIHHSQGRDFEMCVQNLDVEISLKKGSECFLNFVPDCREYRVHVFNGTVLKITRKQKGDNPHKWVHSNDKGWSFLDANPVRVNGYDTIKRECVKAIDKMNLVFGAVDILINENNETFILEINSGAGLKESAVKLYAECFKDYLKNEHRFDIDRRIPLTDRILRR